MPLYSTTEQSRERQWEYQRRTATVAFVASFTQSLVDRKFNRALSLVGGQSATGSEKEVANVSEQVVLLEKLASSHWDVLAHEAKVVEHCLALVAMCEAKYTDQMNRYLQKLAFLPRPTSDI